MNINNRTPQQRAQDAIDRINDNMEVLTAVKESLEIALKNNDVKLMTLLYEKYMNNYNF